MPIFDHLKIAVASLRSNKFRTVLTTLGIIIGVASVITLVSLGNAVQAYISSSFQSLGSNVIFIMPGNSDSQFSGPPSASNAFKKDELDRFMKMPKKYISHIAGNIFSMHKVKYADNDESLRIMGVYGDYDNALSLKAETGRKITADDIRLKRRVAFVGHDVSKKIMDGQDPIGKKIKIEDTDFTVIGTIDLKPSSGFDNDNENIYIPSSSFAQYLGGDEEFVYIIINSSDSETVSQAKEEAGRLMRRVRNIRPGEDNNFTVRDSGELLGSINTIMGFFTIFLAAIAAISLLVGGIGVMNIMFVSITERTKEIGLRKSLGARNRDILFQFLTESMVVSLLGGVVGIILGLVLSYAISIAVTLPAAVSIDAIIMGVVFSLFIGVFFGIYPAKKASKLHPIDALKYE